MDLFTLPPLDKLDQAIFVISIKGSCPSLGLQMHSPHAYAQAHKHEHVPMHSVTKAKLNIPAQCACFLAQNKRLEDRKRKACHCTYMKSYDPLTTSIFWFWFLEFTPCQDIDMIFCARIIYLHTSLLYAS